MLAQIEIGLPVCKGIQRSRTRPRGLQEYRHSVICSRMYFIRVCQWSDNNEHELQRESIPARCRPQHTTQVQVSVFMHAFSTKRDRSACSCSSIQIYIVLRYLNFSVARIDSCSFVLSYTTKCGITGPAHRTHTHTHTRLYTAQTHVTMACFWQASSNVGTRLTFSRLRRTYLYG